jgi:hypothetical protein
MSIQRCIAALEFLDVEIAWIANHRASAAAATIGVPGGRLLEFIRDLTLDIDLRSNGSAALMSKIELELYFPVIGKLLILAKQINSRLTDAQVVPICEAKRIVHVALTEAVRRQGHGAVN